MVDQHVIFVDLHITFGGRSITDRFSLRQALIRRNVPVAPGKRFTDLVWSSEEDGKKFDSATYFRNIDHIFIF